MSNDPSQSDPDRQPDDEEGAFEFNPIGESDDLDEEEFSLESLSAAYAKVLQRDVPEGGAEAGDAAPAGDDAPDSPADRDELNDERDNAPCPINEASVLEALLFVGCPPDVRLTAKKLAACLRDVSPQEVKQIIQRLNKSYAEQNAAYRIVSESGGFRMDLAPDCQRWKEGFYGEVREGELSRPAIDCLAIIAYHQPISRKELESICQRPLGAILNQLSQRQIISGRADEANPKTVLYETTDRFLKLFGLDRLEDLPQTEEIESIDEFFDQ